MLKKRSRSFGEHTGVAKDLDDFCHRGGFGIQCDRVRRCVRQQTGRRSASLALRRRGRVEAAEVGARERVARGLIAVKLKVP